MKIAVENIENWILVTGSIRSGTTFAGKVLSFPLAVDYIHEPFGRWCGLPEVCELPPRYLRPGREDEEERKYREMIARIFRYDFTLRMPNFDNDSWHRKLVKSIAPSRFPHSRIL